MLMMLMMVRRHSNMVRTGVWSSCSKISSLAEMRSTCATCRLNKGRGGGQGEREREKASKRVEKRQRRKDSSR